MPTVASQGTTWVDNTIIADIVQDQIEKSERLRPRLYLDRVPLRDADDGEITAIFTENQMAADIIPPNGKARVVAAGQIEFNVNEVPNIKLGAHLTQSDINRLERLRERGRANTANDEYLDFWGRITRARLESVRDRMNWMCAGMLIGSLTYNRLGVQFTVDFQMPAGAKYAVPVPWSTAATATPITDIHTQINYVALNYNVKPNRLTLTRTDFMNMIATTQFKNLSQTFVGIAATTAINTANLPLMQQYATALLGGVVVEIDDHVYRTEETDGSVTSHVDLPAGTGLLTNTADDGNDLSFDFANAPLTEAIVARLVGMNVDLGGQERGPAVFATAPPDLNAPWPAASPGSARRWLAPRSPACNPSNRPRSRRPTVRPEP
jgi:hypothetical protein